MSLLKRGLRGEPVKRLQEKLGVTADGIFGPGTEKALRDYQSANGLGVDGIAGPETFSHMGLHELVLLRVGSRGPAVKKLQEALGIGADGIFGKGTRKAVMEFQEANGLAADGMAGPNTLSKMSGFASDFTADTIKKAEAPAGAEMSDEPLPEIKGGSVVQSDAGEAAPSKSVWGTIKGWFS